MVNIAKRDQHAIGLQARQQQLSEEFSQLSKTQSAFCTLCDVRLRDHSWERGVRTRTALVSMTIEEEGVLDGTPLRRW